MSIFNNFDAKNKKAAKEESLLENFDENGEYSSDTSDEFDDDVPEYIIDNTDFCSYTSYVLYPDKKTVTVPERMIRICEDTFLGCDELEEIILPESVEIIGANAFAKCEKLKSINIPESVSQIVEGAFYDCSSLTEIVIPEGVDSILDNTFDGCSSLEKVTLPQSLKIIDAWAFMGCESLTTWKNINMNI